MTRKKYIAITIVLLLGVVGFFALKTRSIAPDKVLLSEASAYVPTNITVDTSNWKEKATSGDYTLQFPSEWKLSDFEPFQQPVNVPGAKASYVTNQRTNIQTADYAGYEKASPDYGQGYSKSGLAIGITKTLKDEVYYSLEEDPFGDCARTKHYWATSVMWQVKDVTVGSKPICEQSHLDYTAPLTYYVQTDTARYEIEVMYPRDASPKTKDSYISSIRKMIEKTSFN